MGGCERVIHKAYTDGWLVVKAKISGHVMGIYDLNKVWTISWSTHFS